MPLMFGRATAILVLYQRLMYGASSATAFCTALYYLRRFSSVNAVVARSISRSTSGLL